MARSHLTLAALAASAVDGLDVIGAQPFGSLGGDFDSALLTGKDGRHWVVRVPRTESAEAAQSADLVALRALGSGIRARLPFGVSSYAGQVGVGETRAVVYEFVYGGKVALERIDHALATSIGEAIAAIHALPPSFIADAGLPMQSPVEALRATMTIVERACATHLVPASLELRWKRACDDAGMWQFGPTVVNGALSSGSFLSSAGSVTGVLDWHALHVGDPAVDLHWLLALRSEGLAESAFAAYTRVRGSVDRQLRDRAKLLGELELAKWLLHGTQTRSTEIVDDAVELMSELVDDLASDHVGEGAMPQALGVDEVESLLERAERVR